MTTAPLQRHLFTKRWRKQVEPQKEATFHIQLVAMLRWCIRPDVIWRHVPNGEHRDPRTAAKLKAMGVLPGSADLEFHWAEWHSVVGTMRRMLHLERKVPGRKMSTAQAGFALAMKLLGDEYHVARSIDEAITILGERGLIRSNVECPRLPGGGGEGAFTVSKVSRMTDYALTDDGTGKPLAHRADCPDVRRRADAGEPVMTMLGCAAPLPPDLRRHSCLTENRQR